MVIFMGHALLLGSIGLNVNNVAYTIGDKVGRHLDRAMFCKDIVQQPPAYPKT